MRLPLDRCTTFDVNDEMEGGGDLQPAPQQVYAKQNRKSNSEPIPRFQFQIPILKWMTGQ